MSTLLQTVLFALPKRDIDIHHIMMADLISLEEGQSVCDEDHILIKDLEYESTRILVLDQSQIMDSDVNEIEYDRITKLVQRMFKAKYVLLSFVDGEKQFIKSSAGIDVDVDKDRVLSLPKEASLDATFLALPQSGTKKELCVVNDPQILNQYTALKCILSCSSPLTCYTGAIVQLDRYSIGMLSVFHVENEFSMNNEDDKANLIDISNIVASLVGQRRESAIKYQRERANVMLGLNHHLRTPLTTITVVTEMIRNELEALGTKNISCRSNDEDENLYISPWGSAYNLSNSVPASPRILFGKIRSGSNNAVVVQNTSEPPIEPFNHSISIDVGSNNSAVWKNFGIGMNLSSRATSTGNSRRSSGASSLLSNQREALGKLDRASSFASESGSGSISNPIISLGLLDDLQSSVQQLGLFVEMGLVLGKIALAMNESTSRFVPYEQSQCDIMMIYEKLQQLTQQIGHQAIVQWDLDYLKSVDGDFYVHSDILLAVLISCLTQILPYADKIQVKASLPSNSKDFGGKHRRVFRGGFHRNQFNSFLSTELEIIGNPANLEDIVKQLNINFHDAAQPSDEAAIQCEEFSDSVFAISTLLGSICGDSKYIRTSNGGCFSFSFPCTIIKKNLDKELVTSEIDGEVDLDLRLSSSNSWRPTSNEETVKKEDNEVSGTIHEATNMKHQYAIMSKASLLVASSRRLKVLMVDDSIIVQKVMTQWLKKKNCEVFTAVNGAVALDALVTSSFDVVFLDFLMPVMDGITCLQKYQEHKIATPFTVINSDDQWIIGLSATAMQHDQDLAFRSGMSLFCNKPVDMQALGYILEAKRLELSMAEIRELLDVNRRGVMTNNHEMLMSNIVQLSDIHSNNVKKSDDIDGTVVAIESSQGQKYGKMFGGFQWNTL